MLKRILIAGITGMVLMTNVWGKVVTETVEYKQGETVCEGYLAYDDAITGKRPAVAVVHEWYGLNDYSKMRARMLAELGYVALALDIYGKGNRATNTEEAGKLATMLRKDRSLMRARANAGIDFLRAHALVDPQRIAAIGYCFGGGTVLELARSGADIKGVVSFHGNLDTPNPADAKNIKCKVLVCHGANDPYVGWDAVAAFKDEMISAGVDWQFIAYSGANHSFTNPEANSDGASYHERSDKRSWEDMKQFFGEIFK